MTTTQMVQIVFSITGVLVAIIGIQSFWIKNYLEAKLDHISKQVDLLVQYMILHEGRISTLEERTKNK